MTLSKEIRDLLESCSADDAGPFEVATAWLILERLAIELEAAETEKLWQQTAYLLSQPARGNA